MFQRLGQHFLINKSAIEKIVAALDLQPNETIIEIGPGKGALTNEIIAKLQNCKIAKFILIEKDTMLANRLKKIETEKIKIIEGDALKIIPQLISNQQSAISNYKIIGNIPYYITGKLLRILSELKNKPLLIVLMLQKEVAERICTKPPKMNLLAAAVQFWAEPEIILKLKPNDFNPQPKIYSAVIKLTPKTANSEPLTADYYKLLHIIFKQPRKTVINNLIAGFKIPKKVIEEKLTALKISKGDRPQNLSIEQLKKISDIFINETQTQ